MQRFFLTRSPFPPMREVRGLTSLLEEPDQAQIKVHCKCGSQQILELYPSVSGCLSESAVSPRTPRHAQGRCAPGELAFIKVSKPLLFLWTLADASLKKKNVKGLLIPSDERAIEAQKLEPERSFCETHGGWGVGRSDLLKSENDDKLTRSSVVY